MDHFLKFYQSLLRKAECLATVHLILAGLIFVTLNSCSKKLTSSQLSYHSEKPIHNSVIVGEGTLSKPDLVEWAFHFSADGKVIYIQRQKENKQGSRIYISYYKDGSWSEPILSPFSDNDSFREDGPFVSPDANHFFFGSNRKGSIGEFDIWLAKRSGKGWGTPYRLGEVINSEYNEYLPSVAANGNLYFESTRPSRFGDKQTDLYVSKYVNGRYKTAELLGEEINTSNVNDESPFIAPDESYLIFARNRDYNNNDWIGELFISYHRNGVWTDAQQILLNDPSRFKYSPYVSPDKKYLFYSDGKDIKQVEVKAVGLEL
ncbi:PD40 domain-containing protein [Xanthovirga aplysinae]|uniref:PD40 domain-containing protein n=1 Tax=Xanthovirga aplysinae TaxID=2529853 RepID=UPI0012BC45B4|nr:PD40 domain-containing protein [Xanthovirga aplysinae]MTI30243.1 hypothetical protein [Xanthovirga aplysinae]